MSLELSQCPLCPGLFTRRNNLYQHMRVQHEVNPQLVGSKIPCSMHCGEKFKTHKALRNHLVELHQCVLEHEVVQFVNMEMFEIWKKNIERTTRYKYVIKTSEKILQKGEGKLTYFCNRSGFKNTKKGPLKRPPRRPSLKINAACPSIMEVTRNLADNTIKVVFWKTHVGHDDPAPPNITLVPKSQTVKRNRKKAKELLLQLDVCVVLPAAGSGERMEMDLPKQYLPVHKKPVICYTVDAFIKLPFIKKVIVVTAPDSLNLMLQTLTEMCTLDGDKLLIAEGASTRHQSIKAGIQSLLSCCESTPDIVVVHDGVRPFFPSDLVNQVVIAANDHGAAGVACPLVSTVLSTDDKGFLESTLDRSLYKASEMPQAFKYEVIAKAYDEATEYDMMYGTECLHLVQRYTGVKAMLLDSSTHLWKITHSKDIHAAAAVVKESQSVCVASSDTSLPFLPLLKIALEKKFFSAHGYLRLTPGTFSRFENFVEVHEEKTLRVVLDQMTFPKTTQVISIVHVLLNCLEPDANLLEYQKQTKIIARAFKDTNVFMYFVVRDELETTSTLEELADLVTSLLFESNSHTVGTIFLS